jgi:hypothetical protein
VVPSEPAEGAMTMSGLGVDFDFASMKETFQGMTRDRSSVSGR